MEIPKSMVEAGARGIYDAEPNYEDDPVAPWENVGESTRKRYIEQATACLRSAMVGVEVVYTHKVDHECEASLISDDQPIDERDILFRKGDTIAVFRGGE